MTRALAIAAAFHLALAGTPNAIEEPRFTLALAGDVMLGRLVDGVVAANGPRHVWGDVLPFLRDADFAIVNLECTIAAGGEPFQPPRVFYFRAAPATADALVAAGVDGVALANNHAMDFGPEALRETLRHLGERAIAHAGAGVDVAEAARPAFIARGDVKVALLSFADHFAEYAAGPSTVGTNVIAIRTVGDDFDRVRRAIDAARAGGADLVVFSIHWGPNMREAPTPEFVAFARAVIEAGADVFHGHSAHLFQAIEIHRGKPILYDTGDLIDDYAVDPKLRNDRQVLFLLRFAGNRLERVELVPLRIDHMQVNRARAEDFTAIHGRLRDLSRRFATEIRAAGDRLVAERLP